MKKLPLDAKVSRKEKSKQILTLVKNHLQIRQKTKKQIEKEGIFSLSLLNDMLQHFNTPTLLNF